MAFIQFIIISHLWVIRFIKYKPLIQLWKSSLSLLSLANTLCPAMIVLLFFVILGLFGPLRIQALCSDRCYRNGVTNSRFGKALGRKVGGITAGLSRGSDSDRTTSIFKLHSSSSSEKGRGTNSKRSKKFVVVTGGVISGIGKGVTSSSIGVILKMLNLRPTAMKIDPYLNVDAGTMSPFEHGEVFVLDDGGECDLDLGNYERFMGLRLTSDSNLTTGKVYQVRDM